MIQNNSRSFTATNIGVAAVARGLDALKRDQSATLIGLVGLGMLLGAATLLLSDPASTRNTDTRAEIQARIAPVGTVTVGNRGEAQYAAETAGAAGDS